jgi:glycosyltransferase involved in cell wall biosynthesis
MKTIINVAYPFAPVHESTAGGAEQIVSLIDNELSLRNIRSIVIAQEESQVKGELIKVPKIDGLISNEGKKSIQSKVKELIEYAIQKHNPDLIHFHGLDFYNYLPDAKIISLATLHLPVTLYDIDKLNCCTTHLVCVSLSQRSKCSAIKRLLPDIIQNGIFIPSVIHRKKNPAFAFSLGRICPEKGYHIAIDAAKKAQVPLILAGEVFNYTDHIDYYKSELVPRLDSVNYRFIGKIGTFQKEYLYSNALCVLIPSQIEETSSLVAMEALAHGTPVIAFNRGALTEIIQDGINGFLVNDIDKMAEAIRKVHLIKTENCLKNAIEKYDQRLMTNKYIELYKKLISNKNFH